MVVARLLAVFAVHSLVEVMVVPHLDVIRSLLFPLFLRVFIFRRSVRAHDIPVALENASPFLSVVLKEKHVFRGNDVWIPSGMGS